MATETSEAGGTSALSYVTSLDLTDFGAVEVLGAFVRGEPRTWESPGEPAHFEDIEVRRDGALVRDLSDSQWAEVDAAVERAMHESRKGWL